MKIIQNNIPISPAMNVTCSRCNSIFYVDLGEGRWLKPYSSEDCDSDSWLVYCPACGDPQSYPKIIEKKKTFWELLFIPGDAGML